jgi:hypothetical protein
MYIYTKCEKNILKKVKKIDHPVYFPWYEDLGLDTEIWTEPQ